MPSSRVRFASKTLEKWNTPLARLVLGVGMVVAGIWVAATPPPQPVVQVSRHPHPANNASTPPPSHAAGNSGAAPEGASLPHP